MLTKYYLSDFWPKKLSLNKAAVFVSFVVTIIQVYQQRELDHMLLRTLEYFSFNTFIFLACSLTRVTFRFLLFLYTLCFVFLWTVKLKLGVEVGIEATTSFFEATRSEVLAFLGKDLITLVVFALVLGCIMLVLPLQARTRAQWKWLIYLLVANTVILFIPAVIHYSVFHKNGVLYQRVIPNNFLTSSKEYLKDNYFYALHLQRSSITQEFKVEYIPKDLNVVLIIGESARSDRFSINGYERDTSPELKKIKNLISWPNTTSCGVSTAISVPCMFTRQTRSEFRFPVRELSLISVMKDLGFSTHYLSTQNTGANPTIFQICKEAGDCQYDPVCLTDEPLFDMFFATLKKDHSARRLIILHQLGSHFLYSTRYPEAFSHFNPTCRGAAVNCSKEEIDNAYDNTIRYTDHLIGTVNEALNKQKTLFIYISDHGEALGEFGRYGHGSLYALSLQVQKSVPFFIWFSDPLLKDPVFKERFKKLQSRRSEQLSHDYLFYTVLGCSGIVPKSDSKEKVFNLCR